MATQTPICCLVQFQAQSKLTCHVPRSDNDQPVYHEEEATRFQISIYGARGILIESEDPSWFYGGASEHAVLYQYQLVNAKNVRSDNGDSPPEDARLIINGSLGFLGTSSDRGAVLSTQSWRTYAVRPSPRKVLRGPGLQPLHHRFLQDGMGRSCHRLF